MTIKITKGRKVKYPGEEPKFEEKLELLDSTSLKTNTIYENITDFANLQEVVDYCISKKHIIV